MPARASHAMVVVNNKAYVIGGYSASGVLHDAYVIDLGIYFYISLFSFLHLIYLFLCFDIKVHCNAKRYQTIHWE